MRIGVYGYTDKRPLIYGLMLALQSSGATVVVTDNVQYRRLTEDDYFGDIKIVVTNLTPDEVWEDLDENITDFNNIIYDLKDYYNPEEIDKLIYVIGSTPTEGEEEFMELLEDYVLVKLMYDHKDFPNALCVPIYDEVFKTIEYVERYKSFRMFNDKKLIKVVSEICAELTDIPEREFRTYINSKRKEKKGWFK